MGRELSFDCSRNHGWQVGRKHLSPAKSSVHIGSSLFSIGHYHEQLTQNKTTNIPPQHLKSLDEISPSPPLYLSSNFTPHAFWFLLFFFKIISKLSQAHIVNIDLGSLFNHFRSLNLKINLLTTPINF